MKGARRTQWEHFDSRYFWFESIGLGLDLSRAKMPLDYAEEKREMIVRAPDGMRALEAGAIANKDESRMVGHYWFRNPTLTPTQEIRNAIDQAINSIKAFAADVHEGRGSGTADADGFDRIFAQVEQHWGETLCIVISNPEGTKETRNAVIEVEVAYEAHGLAFVLHTWRGSHR
jgi:glucose-6-phosphate isomerase